jgi:hypothetical protein
MAGQSGERPAEHRLVGYSGIIERISLPCFRTVKTAARRRRQGCEGRFATPTVLPTQSHTSRWVHQPRHRTSVSLASCRHVAFCVLPTTTQCAGLVSVGLWITSKPDTRRLWTLSNPTLNFGPRAKAPAIAACTLVSFARSTEGSGSGWLWSL